MIIPSSLYCAVCIILLWDINSQVGILTYDNRERLLRKYNRICSRIMWYLNNLCSVWNSPQLYWPILFWCDPYFWGHCIFKSFLFLVIVFTLKIVLIFELTSIFRSISSLKLSIFLRSSLFQIQIHLVYIGLACILQMHFQKFPKVY